MMADTQVPGVKCINYFVVQTLRNFEDLSVKDLEKKD